MSRLKFARCSLKSLTALFFTEISDVCAKRQDLFLFLDPENWLAGDPEFTRRLIYYFGGGRPITIVSSISKQITCSDLENNCLSPKQSASVAHRINAALFGRILFARATKLTTLLQRRFPGKFFVLDWKTPGYRDSVWRWLAASNSVDFSKLKERWATFPLHGNEVVILGTGPSASLIFEEPYRSMPVITCNTALKSDRLRTHRIAAFCIADALYFLAPTEYGKKVAEMLKTALYGQSFPVVINAEFYDFFRRRMPFIPEKLLFPVALSAHFQTNVDFRARPTAVGGSSVFPILMLPLAIGCYKKIHLIGFDGKDPKMKNYFWKHADEFQFHAELPTVKEHDPGSFGDRAPDFYDKYNEGYSSEIQSLLDLARSRGAEVHMVHPSFVPALKCAYEAKYPHPTATP